MTTAKPKYTYQVRFYGTQVGSYPTEKAARDIIKKGTTMAPYRSIDGYTVIRELTGDDVGHYSRELSGKDFIA